MANDTTKQKKKIRISNITMVLMVSVALCLDLTELLLDWLVIGTVLNPFIAIWGALSFWLWFQFNGVSYFVSPVRVATAALAFFAELVPGLDGLGGFFWTVGIILMVVMVRFEDITGLSVPLPGLSSLSKIGRLFKKNPVSEAVRQGKSVARGYKKYATVREAREETVRRLTQLRQLRKKQPHFVSAALPGTPNHATPHTKTI